MPVPAAEAEALPRSSSSLAVAACGGRLPAPRTLSRKAAIHSTSLKTHECFACKTSNAFIWRISAIIKLARRQNKQKISRVLFHLLSLFLPVRSLKHCYNIAPQRIPAAPRTNHIPIYIFIHTDLSRHIITQPNLTIETAHTIIPWRRHGSSSSSAMMMNQLMSLFKSPKRAPNHWT